MKRAQIITIGLAGVLSIGAFFGLKTMSKPPQVQHLEKASDAVKVLVARGDIGLGSVTNESSFRWQEYPEASVPPGSIQCRSQTCSMREYSGSIARAPIMKEELITRSKIVKAGEGGVLASILPQGMRGISTKITEESAVGKLILPNDHVDVILIRRLRSKGGQEEHVSDTLFRNVKVLAIGQKIEVKDGQKVADGNTATLELTPRQAELLALARSMGDITLALRSIADFKESKDEAADARKDEARSNAVRMLKYGIRSRAYGVN